MKFERARTILIEQLQLIEDMHRLQSFYYVGNSVGPALLLPPVVTLPQTVGVNERELADQLGLSVEELCAVADGRIRRACALLKATVRMILRIECAAGMDDTLQAGYYRAIGSLLTHIGRMRYSAAWQPTEQKALQDVQTRAAAWSRQWHEPLSSLGRELLRLV